jgi:serine/threonine protein kinase
MLYDYEGNVLITDFGMSRFVSPHIVPQDNYTGTLFYASPEILLKSSIDNNTIVHTVESWKASDCWAVGASLIDLLTDSKTLAFFNVKGVEVLQTIFNRLGAPKETDGVTYNLLKESPEYKNYKPSMKWKMNFSQFSLRNRTTVDFIMSHINPSIKPSELQGAQFKTVCNIINGFLTYNPENRLTIEGALDMIKLTPTKPVIPKLYNQLVTEPIKEGLHKFYINCLLNEKSAGKDYFILDRFFIYSMRFMNIKPVDMDDELFLTSVLFLTFSLFGKNIAFVEAYKIFITDKETKPTKEEILMNKGKINSLIITMLKSDTSCVMPCLGLAIQNNGDFCACMIRMGFSPN